VKFDTGGQPIFVFRVVWKLPLEAILYLRA